MSVDAKELRIGNWVMFSPSGKYNVKPRIVKIKELLDKSTVTNDIELSLELFYGSAAIQPIPLTKEILEKCGFKHGKTGKKTDDTFVEFWDSKTPSIHKHSFGSFYFSVVRWWEGNKPLEFTFSHHEIRVDCKYVHQLQNLYFALTGTEINLTL